MLGAVQVGGNYFDPFGAYSFDPPALGPDGRTLFFQGCTADAGCELWRSDGSLHGTYLLRDLAPGSASSFPAGFLRDGRRILFGVLGALWSTDGTATGTLRLTSTRAGGRPERLLGKPQPHAGKLYFFASGVFAGEKDLWVYDPQSPRSPQARRLHSFSVEFFSHASADFAAVGGRLFILAFDDNADTLPLWEVTDTRAGLTKVGPPSAFTSLSSPHEAGGRIVFAATLGREAERLWTLSPGMKRPFPLTGCPGGCPTPDTGPAVEVKGRLFFPGRDAAHGVELWVTDGTAAGTRRVADLCPGACDGGPVQMRPALGEVVFTDRQGFLWASDGTAAGTVRLADTGILPPLFNVPPLDLTEAGGRIVFNVLDPATGRQPFVSDLTAAGTHPLAQIGSPLAASSSPHDLAPLGARVVFLACAAGTGSVWISDGTAAGTFTIPGTAEPCPVGRPPVFLQRVGRLGFFDRQGKLWRTDGTAAGTFPVLTLPAGVSSLRNRIALGDKLLFLLPPPDFPPSDDGWDWTVWTSDGTPEGTAAVFPLRLGSDLEVLAAGGEGEVLFTAVPPTSRDGQFALWRTDGTAAGTRILLPRVSWPLETARLGGATYFLSDGGPGANLWTTDGTAAGTRPIVPEDAPAALVDAHLLTVFDGALYFFAGGYPNGGDPPQPPQALWRSDGTAAGTRIVKTIDLHREPFAGLLWPELTVAGGHLFFRAEDADHGAELWTTDGTP
jgi:ELWxxDGT repeat protein